MEAAVDALGSDLTVTGARKVRKGIPGIKSNEHFEVLASPPGIDTASDSTGTGSDSTTAVEALLGDAESVVDNAFAALLAQAEDEELSVSPAVRLPKQRTTPHPAPDVVVAPDVPLVTEPAPPTDAIADDRGEPPVVGAPVLADAGVEAPVVEAPVVEAPVVVEAPAVVEAPVIEAPAVESPATAAQGAHDTAPRSSAPKAGKRPAGKSIASKPPRAKAASTPSAKPSTKAPTLPPSARAAAKPAAKPAAKVATKKAVAAKPPVKKAAKPAAARPTTRSARAAADVPPGWSRAALAALGLPDVVLAALPAKDPASDLAWVAALERALTRTVPGPRTLGAEAPCVLAAHGVDGVVQMITTSIQTGLPVGVVTVAGGRVAPATATELALVLRSAVLGGAS